MKILKKMDLEWKLIGIALVLFLGFYFPVQNLFQKRLYQTMINSSDPLLETHLREQIRSERGVEQQKSVELLQRQLQWKAAAPLVMREQQTQFQQFSALLLGCLFVGAFLSFSRLTRPLRQLASAVVKIGRGERAEIRRGSGGSLGLLEERIFSLQEELAHLREESQLQGMERAWRDIARVMAHEIKNPLTPMRLSIDRIDEKIASQEEISREDLERCTARMNRQLDSLEQLVNRFRSFSREPTAFCTSIDLVALINEIAEDMVGTIQTQCHGSGVAFADGALLRQVVLNIYKNSVAAGSSIIEVTVVETAQMVEITLADNGKGVAPERVGMLFLPYVTFSEGGSGIGLSVVKNLVEAMDGSVSATSAEGKGFTVVMQLKRGNDGAE